MQALSGKVSERASSVDEYEDEEKQQSSHAKEEEEEQQYEDEEELQEFGLDKKKTLEENCTQDPRRVTPLPWNSPEASTAISTSRRKKAQPLRSIAPPRHEVERDTLGIVKLDVFSIFMHHPEKLLQPCVQRSRLSPKSSPPSCVSTTITASSLANKTTLDKITSSAVKPSMRLALRQPPQALRRPRGANRSVPVTSVTAVSDHSTTISFATRAALKAMIAFKRPIAAHETLHSFESDNNDDEEEDDNGEVNDSNEEEINDSEVDILNSSDADVNISETKREDNNDNDDNDYDGGDVKRRRRHRRHRCEESSIAVWGCDHTACRFDSEDENSAPSEAADTTEKTMTRRQRQTKRAVSCDSDNDDAMVCDENETSVKSNRQPPMYLSTRSSRQQQQEQQQQQQPNLPPQPRDRTGRFLKINSSSRKRKRSSSLQGETVFAGLTKSRPQSVSSGIMSNKLLPNRRHSTASSLASSSTSSDLSGTKSTPVVTSSSVSAFSTRSRNSIDHGMNTGPTLPGENSPLRDATNQSRSSSSSPAAARGQPSCGKQRPPQNRSHGSYSSSHGYGSKEPKTRSAPTKASKPRPDFLGGGNLIKNKCGELIAVDMSPFQICDPDAEPVVWKGQPLPVSEDLPRYSDLNADELIVCETLRLSPAQYLDIKETLLSTIVVRGPYKKRDAQGWFRIDVNKTNKLYDWFVGAGWIEIAGEEWEKRSGGAV